VSFPLIEAALNDFERDLLRAQRLLELMVEFKGFGSSTPPHTSTASNWPAAESLHKLAGPVRTDLPVFSGSILLYLAGRFEYFIAQSVEVATDALVADAKTYNDLPVAVRKQLRAKTLEVARDPRKYRLEEAEVAQLLEDLVEREKPGGTSFSVDSRLVSMTDSNMRPDIIDEVLKRIGLEGVWTELGKQTDLKLYFGITTDGQCKQAARTRLNDLMTERNEVAHPTGSTNFASAEEVLEHVRFLLLLGKSLSGQFLLHLNASLTQQP
jgi:hypothetical protein